MPNLKNKKTKDLPKKVNPREILSPGRGHFGTYHDGGVKYVILNPGLFKLSRK